MQYFVLSLPCLFCFTMYSTRFIQFKKNIIKETLVVIIFHCTLKNTKQLIKSSLYPRRPTDLTKEVKLFFPNCQMLSYPHKNKWQMYFIFILEFELLFWLIFLKDDLKNIKFAHVFDKTERILFLVYFLRQYILVHKHFQ